MSESAQTREMQGLSTSSTGMTLLRELALASGADAPAISELWGHIRS
jgi:hypothetical protein